MFIMLIRNTLRFLHKIKTDSKCWAIGSILFDTNDNCFHIGTIKYLISLIKVNGNGELVISRFLYFSVNDTAFAEGYNNKSTLFVKSSETTYPYTGLAIFVYENKKF